VAVRDPLEADLHGGPLTNAAEAILGHTFARSALLREALTHRSAAGQKRASNERLEFIGDRVLGLLIAEWLAERFIDEQEGALGRRLAQLVSQPVLAALAQEIGLNVALSVAPGEARAGVRRKATVLADALEAAIGALYLDGGLDTARQFVRRVWTGPMDLQSEPPKDPKTALQEWAQARGLALPSYALEDRHGPAHAPVFRVIASVEGISGSGTAGNKRAAEQLAAADLLAKLCHEASSQTT